MHTMINLHTALELYGIEIGITRVIWKLESQIVHTNHCYFSKWNLT